MRNITCKFSHEVAVWAKALFLCRSMIPCTKLFGDFNSLVVLMPNCIYYSDIFGGGKLVILHGHVPGKEGLKPGKTSHKMVESCINKITFKNGICKFYNLVKIFYFIYLFLQE